MALIVVMEDDPNEGDLFCQLLRIAGHETRLFDGAQAALDHIAGNAVDVVITDVFVRREDAFVPDGGQRLILTVRQLMRIESRILPIIAISGGLVVRSRASSIQMARDLGADAFFEKPVPIRDLLLTVEGMLEARGKVPPKLPYGIID